MPNGSSSIDVATDAFRQDFRLFGTMFEHSAVAESDGVLLVATGLPSPWMNRALVSGQATSGWLADAETFFVERSLPHSITLMDGVADPGLAERGYELAGEVPFMIWDVNDAAFPIPEGYTIETARDEAAFARFAEAQAIGYEMPREMSDTLADAFHRSGVMRTLVASASGTPVGTAVGMPNDGAVGIYNVSTAPEHRKLGIGAALTATAARSTSEPIAYLESSAAGLPVYERMGFHVVARRPTWTRSA